MKIKNIELTNVKCYSKIEFTFENGINFISGINGAGKTSIIESIGFALFDYKIGKGFNSYFIKRGEKKATVRINFEDKNNEEYIVERKLSITANNSWIIKDIEDEEEIVSGEIDVINWLKDHLGFYRDDNIAQIYENIISVPQGRFTSAFLDTTQNRKNTFDPIFNLEIYRTVYKNTASLDSGLKKKKIDYESDVKVINAKIEMLEKSKEEYDKIKKDNIEQQQIEKEKKKEFNKLDKLYQEKNNIRNKIINIEKAIDIGTLQENNICKNMEVLKCDLKTADEAKKILDDNKEEYEIYIQEEKKQKGLRKKQKEFDSLNKEKMELANKIDTCNNTVNIKNETKLELKGTIKCIENDKKELEEEIKNQNIILNKKLLELEQERRNISELKQNEEKIEEYKKIIDNNTLLIKNDLDNINRLNKIIAKEKGLVEKQDKLEECIKTKEKVEQQKLEIEEKLNKLFAKLELIQESKKIAKKGVCPYLKTECINVKGKTQEEYEIEQEDVNREIIVLKKDKQQTEKKEKEIVRAETELNNIVIKIIEVEETKKEIYKIQKTLKEKQDMNEEAQRNIYKILEEYEIGKDVKNIKDFKAISEKMQREFNNKDTQYNVLKTEIENMKKDLRKKEMEIEKSNKLTEKLDLELQENKQLIKEYTNKMENLKESLEKYGTIENDIEQNEKLLQKTREAYNKYIQNQEIANKLKDIQKKLEKYKKEIQIIQKNLKESKNELEELSKNYDEIEFKQLEINRSELQILLATIGTKINSNNERIEKLKNQLEELRQAQEEIKEKNKNIVIYEKAIQNLSKIRQIIKQAPEDIAEILIQKVSTKATEIYSKIANDNTRLEWREGYEVVLIDCIDGRIIEKEFRQLSGGEQMSAALAIRISMLEILTSLKLGILDEPTVNMDTGRRQRLAEIIESIGGLFIQLFVVSHDDTFNSITEHTIKL